jgi:ankyrin repeat protein
MLLERGARINTRDNVNGRTPLHWAVWWGNIQAVQLLLEHGADVNASDKSGKTPSQLISASSEQEIVELLSKYGAESGK